MTSTAKRSITARLYGARVDLVVDLDIHHHRSIKKCSIEKHVARVGGPARIVEILGPLRGIPP